MADAPLSEEALFVAMRAALDPGPVAPSPESVHAVRLAVHERWGPIAAAVPSRARRWSRRSVALSAVTAALTLGGGSVAFARPALPGPLRDMARMAGLHVGLTPAARVRVERSELQRSVDAGDVGRIRTDLQDLDRAESKLSPPEQEHARVSNDDLELRAQEITGGETSVPGDERQGATIDPEPAPPPTPPSTSSAEPDQTTSAASTAPPSQATSDDHLPTVAATAGLDVEHVEPPAGS